MNGGEGRTRGVRRIAALAALLAAATVACGIRSTDVPVDAGPAPTRTTCESPGDMGGTEDTGDTEGAGDTSGTGNTGRTEATEGTGATGYIGDNGDNENTGETGDTAASGETGATGGAGATGDTGDNGDTRDSGDVGSAAAAEAGVTEIYLVCGAQVEAVWRSVELSPDQANPVDLARALLEELQADPGDAEQAAGFSSDVPPDLSVSGTAPMSDYGPGLRLSEGPGDLPAFALVQIICTFAHSAPLGDGHSVVLSGPPGSTSEQPKPYSCSAAMRASHHTSEG